MIIRAPSNLDLFYDYVNMKSCLSGMLMQVAWEKGVEQERSFSRKYKTVKSEKQEDWVRWELQRFREGSWRSCEASSPGVQLQERRQAGCRGCGRGVWAAQEQQNKRMVLVMGKGKRVGKAAVTFSLLMNLQVSCDSR